MSTSPRSRRLPGQTLACGWCAEPIELQPTGRLPRWCSANCRHRAWEQRRASGSDRSPVQINDRVVAVEVEVPVQVVERVTVETMPSGRGWAKQMEELMSQVQAGAVYDRDLPDLARALDAVSQAIEQRPGWIQLLRRSARAQRQVSSYGRH